MRRASNQLSREREHPRLRTGTPRTPEGGCLWLLPSGPDQVHSPSLPGTRSSTPVPPTPIRVRRPSAQHHPRIMEDFGFRTPPASRLHGKSDLAERGGFEPPGQDDHPHAFQACSFDRSDTSPIISCAASSKNRSTSSWLLFSPVGWRRGRDSNPRTRKTSHRFSRPTHSTALAPLQLTHDSTTGPRSCLRDWKNSVSIAAAAAAPTPALTTGRWFRRGSARISKTDPQAPAFRSAAP